MLLDLTPPFLMDKYSPTGNKIIQYWDTSDCIPGDPLRVGQELCWTAPDP